MQVELKHTVEILHEEQERIVKIETIKKSLEVEVKVSWRYKSYSFWDLNSDFLSSF